MRPSVTVFIIAIGLVITGCASDWHVQSNTASANSALLTQSVSRRPSTLNVIENKSLTIAIPQNVPDQSAFDVLVPPDFLNRDEGFVIQPGGLMYTADGGQTWKRISAPVGQIDGVEFTSPEHGWVVTSTGSSAADTTKEFHLFRTTDGGVHWTSEWNGMGSSPDWPDHPRVFPFSQQTSFAWVGGHLLKRLNQSSTWSDIKLPVPGPVVEADFVRSDLGWAVVEQTDTASASQLQMSRLVLLQTFDGGNHWHVQLRTAPFHGGSAMLQFGSSTNGMLLYKDTNRMQTVVYRTTDGGQSWSKSIPADLGGRIFAGRPVFETPNSVWVPMNAGAAPFASSILESDDMGRTWHTVVQGSEWRLVDLSRRFGDTAYALSEANSENALLKTTDNGQTWMQILPAPTPSKEVSFVSPTIGYALGTAADENAILKTTDAGKSWTEVGSLPDGAQGYDISFSNSSVGYVTVSPTNMSIGQGNTMVLKTNDGGKTWSPTLSGALPAQMDQRLQQGDIVTPVYMSVTRSGQWVVGTSGYPKLYTLTSADQETKIEATYDAPPGAIEGYAFLSPTDGWMSVCQTAKSSHLEDQSVIEQLDATNGSWVTQWILPNGWAVEGMYRLSSKDAWILAQKPLTSLRPTFAIFRTTDGGHTWTQYQSITGPHFTPPVERVNSTFQICFVNPDDGWLLTQQGLLQTTDGGAAWTWMH